MKISHPVARALAVLAAVASAFSASAQTGLLNDTGQTSCYDTGNNPVACDAASAGNNSALPHQDGRYGRDAANAAGTLAKTGGGDAGFDFSCVLWNGMVVNSPSCTGTLVPNTTGAASSTPSTDWACTKDNVTGLVWSFQTPYVTGDALDSPFLANPGHNSDGRCGYSSGWRLPSRTELAGIAHRGRTGPSIDTNYFPGAVSSFYWAGEPVAGDTFRRWAVEFLNGTHAMTDKSDKGYVRFVRSAP
ncbi:DUF1566 domain-containing protein [Acidovorax sp. M2(2025)]|uniref:Lcl C-terminal domain-containing protein n=1 Tax=Acidovorax sp. M2(2025) TaxID=3411355 RepID=UPI003BF58CB6